MAFKDTMSEYISGGSFASDFAEIYDAATSLPTKDEPTAQLPIPAALETVGGSKEGIMALLGVMTVAFNDEAAELGVKVYTALVGGSPKIIARMTGS